LSNSKATSEAANHRPQHQCFEFVSYILKGHTLRLNYHLTGGPDPDHAFCEELSLPETLPPPNPNDPVTQALLRACLFVFGVSYYKAALPVCIKGPCISEDEALFWNLLYGEGMGEFYFRNGLDIPDRVGFEALASKTEVHSRATLCSQTLPERALVLIGGGKDSALVAEIVQTSGVEAQALALGNSDWMKSSAAASHLNLHCITRKIDPSLLALNARGAWNGHVPISACIAVVSTLVAHSAGFTDVLVGNERGADDANTIWNGRGVNHQWSKSSLFESQFQRWCSIHAPGAPRYASLLRPLSEIRIASAFSQCKNQHPAFTSCNRNFRIQASEHPPRWCGECAKCTFVALILAPHLSDTEQKTIFGQAILTQECNLAHLHALLGLKDVKPWDCVGTVKECWLSLLALQRQGRLPSSLDTLAAQAPLEFAGPGFDQLWAEEWALKSSSLLSEQWQKRLDAYLNAH
jgi:UDP-N-acetyl-alpha-D-muramoyl-L-alanyl-L-glutamate epimerase